MSKYVMSVIMVVLVLIMTATIIHNTVETHNFLSNDVTRYDGSDFFSYCRGQEGGNAAILGKLLHDTNVFGNKNKYFILPDDERVFMDYSPDGYFFRKVGWLRQFTLMFSYPIAIRAVEYDWLIDKDEFEYLKIGSTFLLEGYGGIKFFLRNTKPLGTEDELAVFVYENTFIIAPLKWKSEKISGERL